MKENFFSENRPQTEHNGSHSFDPDKRVEIKNNDSVKESNSFDPDKRVTIDSNKTELSNNGDATEKHNTLDQVSKDNLQNINEKSDNTDHINSEIRSTTIETNEDDKLSAESDHDKRVEKTSVQGGSYRDIKRSNDSEGKEVHHMPAVSASKLEYMEGSAILMDASDHKKTASWGNSTEARAYQAEQRKLIESGNFREAFEMDVNDIQSKFGDKYDDAIAEARAYIDKLEQEGKI